MTLPEFINQKHNGLDLTGLCLYNRCVDSLNNPKTDLYENWCSVWSMATEILHDIFDPAPLTKSLALLALDYIGLIDDMPRFCYHCRTKNLIIYSCLD